MLFFVPMPLVVQPPRHARGRWPVRGPAHVMMHAPLGHRRALRRVPLKVKAYVEIEWSVPEVVAHDC